MSELDNARLVGTDILTSTNASESGDTYELASFVMQNSMATDSDSDVLDDYVLDATLSRDSMSVGFQATTDDGFTLELTIERDDLLIEHTTSGGGSGSAVWGGITGTLSNQTDLKNVLDSKYELPSTGMPSTDMSEAVQASLAKADSALQSEVGTLSCASSSPNFVVSGVSISSTNLQHCRYVIKFTNTVTSVGTNNLVYLSIGGFNNVLYFDGSPASLTNRWIAGDNLDVWYDNGIWRATKAEYSKISYDVWGETTQIERPS